MNISIRNMVCRHCIEAVRKALYDAGFDVTGVELGHASVEDCDDVDKKLTVLDGLLADLGFERVTDSDIIVVEKIKHAILDHVRSEEDCRLNLSECLEDHLGMSYSGMSRVFSRIEGRTIEKYHIAQKIEYVKELLETGAFTISEIAFKVGYSSTAHLSRQFKEVTGMTPTQYIESGGGKRRPINEI